MMKERLLIVLLLCVVLLAANLRRHVAFPAVHAQGTAPDVPPEELDERLARIGTRQCRNAVHQALAREQRTFRSVIFGLSPAEKAEVGEVRYDNDGIAWYKTETDTWRTAAEGIGSTQHSDEAMAQQSQVPPRRGLLETRGVTTSELIPFIGQSMRALQCRTQLLCNAVRQSIEQTGFNAQEITAHALGCQDMATVTFESCHLAAKEGLTVSDQTDARTYCGSIGESMLEQEMSTMKLVVTYDAAYRTMLQLAGNFDLFLQEFRFPIIRSLRQMVNLAGSLQRIPCFLSSCDASPPPPGPPPSAE